MAMIRPETEMKDTGIEWIGNIPSSWVCCKQKYVISLINGRAFKDTEFEEDGKYRILRVGNFFSNPKWYSSNLELEDDKYCYNGDLLYAWSMSYGPYIWNGEKVIYHYHIWKAKLLNNLSKRFAYYYLIALSDSIKSDVHETTMSFITMKSMNNSYIAFPEDIFEQQAIADYLDETCSKIDEIIAEAKASIDEHKELKQSVIFEAVTKGLDKNVEMKDSGVEWIGEIPVDWNIAKINRVAWTTSGATPLRSKETEYYDNAVIRWVRTLDLNNGHVTDSSEKITETALKNSSCSIMPVKTVCVAMYGGSGTIGKSGILEVECATNQAICSIVSDKKVLNPDYLHYVIMAVRKYWMKYAVGTRKDPNINQQIIAQMRIPIPQLSKQDIIVNHLDKVTDKCDSLIAEKESLINDLEAYKKSLIYEVVTGKRRVV
ncbi:restriction endonuclease subunit S [Blautia sp. Marseille-P3087]|uniref:restriction endonuclease subunit S n=1 Tax=Blautia sp. Marseille-P3087 TaxID=1917876 RepID=UPI00093122F8|nr:restriction endonuclease subunit S [Blautia sp. Marseille-P3087]